MLVKPTTSALANLKVVGVGGGGNNAVNNMIANYDIDGVEFVAVNTDAQALGQSNAEVKIKIGEEITRGLGSGGNPSIGRKAAEESIDLLHEHLAGADMVFITAGMGGGTGTGASPVIAGVAKNLGALTVGVVTKPFNFEGKRRMETALEGIEQLKEKVDTLIVVPNQKLLDVIDRNISFLDAMKQVDDVLAHAVRSIANLITRPGLINVDFADVKSVMNQAGTALMGMGVAKGENRAKMAAQLAVSSPLLEISIDGAQGVLFNVIGGPDMSMQEVDDAANFISESVDGDANIIFGATIDESKKDDIEITVLATGFGAKEQRAVLENRVDEMGLGNKATQSSFGMSMDDHRQMVSGRADEDEARKNADRLRSSDEGMSKFDDQYPADDEQDDKDAMEERKRFGFGGTNNRSKSKNQDRPGISSRETSLSDQDEDDLETPSFLRRKEY